MLAQSVATHHGYSLLLARISTPRHARRLQETLLARVGALLPARRLLPLELELPVVDLPAALAQTVVQQRPDAILLFLRMAHASGEDVWTCLKQFGAKGLASDVPCPVLLWLPEDMLHAFASATHAAFQKQARVYLFEEPSALADLRSQMEVAPLDAMLPLKNRFVEEAGRPLFHTDLTLGRHAALQQEILRNARAQGRSAETYFKEHSRELPSLGRPDCRDYLALGNAALRTPNLPLAIRSFDKAGRMATEEDDPPRQIKASLLHAVAQARAGNLPAALMSAQFALFLAKGLGVRKLVGKAAMHLQLVCRRLCAQRGESIPERAASADAAAPVPAAQNAERESLSALLQATLPRENDFDQFCLEHFLAFAAAYSLARSRNERTELLLSTAPPERIRAALATTGVGASLMEAAAPPKPGSTGA